MSVNVIDTLKPKNGLNFPVVEAIDVFVEGFDNLADAVSHFATDAMIAAINVVLSGKANTSDVNTATANLQAQIDQIAQTAGTGTADTEIGQARVGIDGTTYSTLHSRLDAEIGTLSTGYDDLINYLISEVATFEVGGIDLSNGTDTTPTSSSAFYKRMRSNFIPAHKDVQIKYDVANADNLIVIEYGEDKSFISSSTWNNSYTVQHNGYIRLQMRKSDNSDISVSDITSIVSDTFILFKAGLTQILLNKNNIDSLSARLTTVINDININNAELTALKTSNISNIAEFEIGGIDNQTGSDTTPTSSSAFYKRLRSTFIAAKAGDIVSYNLANADNLIVVEYDSKKSFISGSAWDNRYIVQHDGYIRIQLRKSDNSVISESDIAVLLALTYMSGSKEFVRISQNKSEIDYLVQKTEILDGLKTTASVSNQNVTIGIVDGKAIVYPGSSNTISKVIDLYKGEQIEVSISKETANRFRIASFPCAYADIVDAEGEEPTEGNVIISDDELLTYSFEYSTETDNACLVMYVTNSSEDVTVTNTLYSAYIDKRYVNSGDDYSGLKILNLGDSIAYGAGADGTGYADIIAQKYGMSVYDYAISGLCIRDVDGGNCIYKQALQAIENNINPDIVLIDGGTNDIGHVTEEGGVIDTHIGELSYSRAEARQRYDGENLDTTTFLGALETIFYNYKTAFPTVPIIYVIAHSMNTRREDLQIQFREAIIECCEKWGVPYVDLYTKFNTNIVAVRNECGQLLPDETHGGTHPNLTGYKKYYCPPLINKIKEFVSLE